MREMAGGFAALLLAGVSLSAMAQGKAPDRCSDARDLRIVNGHIHTMDARGTVLSSVTIEGGRFVAGTGAGNPCLKVLDVHGRTVVPGLIDNHNHFVLLSERPGHDTRLESATSIAEVESALAARSHTVAGGAWITAMGGWVPGQLAEKRVPMLTELDQALPDNPALLFVAFTGPAVTNSRGKGYLAAHGVAVADNGAIAAGAPSLAALHALAALQTAADRRQGALDAMAYSASLGVTTNVDMGEFVEHPGPQGRVRVRRARLGRSVRHV